MKRSIPKILFAGLFGGITLNVSMFLTFNLLGFGWDKKGILLDSSIQSAKLIAVWTEIEPIPLIISKPIFIIFGLIVFAIIHAFIYHWLSPHWPRGIKARTLRMAMLIFLFSFLFWEFFTPFNQFGEPLGLIGLELLFWLVIAVTEALAIVVVLDKDFSVNKKKG